jgi:autotransporter-associated beta strand protein
LDGTGHVSLGAGLLGIGINSGISVFAGNIDGTGTIFKANNGTQVFNGTNTYTGMTLVLGGVLQVDGFQPASLVQIDGIAQLQGSGTVGEIDMTNSGSLLAPGNGPGILTCSNYNADGIGDGTLQIELNGTAPGSGYDQIDARGTVNLSNQTLSLSLNFPSALSDQFVIINNDGNDPILGTFNGLPQNSTVTVAGVQFQISYLGGDGNDVVLTQISGTTPQPQLMIELISTNVVRLLWPTNPPSFNLECSTNLAITNWFNASPPPSVVGTNNVVTNATSGAQRFYRLKK